MTGLTVYFDLHSPYSYLAYYYIRHSEVFQQCDIRWVPIQLVAMAKAKIATPPWSVPNKANYLWKDVARWAEATQIPWQPGVPANYPNTRTAAVQRALVACCIECPGRLTSVVDLLYHQFWVEKKGIQLPEVFEPVFNKVLGGADSEKVLRLGASECARTILRKNTEEAIVTGAPGLPWIVAVNDMGKSEGFWGFDHLGLIARFLKLEKVPSPHL